MKHRFELADTIIDLSDAFIFMKGQLGTLEELFRTINSKKSNYMVNHLPFINNMYLIKYR